MEEIADSSPSPELASDPCGNGGTLRLQVQSGSWLFSAEGEAATVLKAFSDFHQYFGMKDVMAMGAPPAPLKEESGSTTAQDKNSEGGFVKSKGEHDELLPVFLKNRPKLKTNKQIAAGIAVWAHRHDGKKELDYEEFTSFWRNSGHKEPRNLKRDVGDAAKQGWLTQEGGKYVPTTYGEKFVDEAMGE